MTSWIYQRLRPLATCHLQAQVSCAELLEGCTWNFLPVQLRQEERRAKRFHPYRATCISELCQTP